MSFPHFTESGFDAICDSGIANMQDDCPCVQCGDFDKYGIIYVDKHATGTGDGSSWENAYTDIQTAINAHPKKQIQIKGYGENDCYPAGITLVDCVYLKGVGDVYLDGNNTVNTGINGANLDSTKIETVTVKNCVYGFRSCTLLDGCKGVNNSSISFYGCSNASLNECISDSTPRGFSGCSNSFMTDCSVTNNSSTGYGYSNNTTFSGCSVNAGGYGFYRCEDCIFLSCSASNGYGGFVLNHRGTFTDCSGNTSQSGFGTNSDSNYLNCSASDNLYCGFEKDSSSNFIGCTASGNGFPSSNCAV